MTDTMTTTEVEKAQVVVNRLLDERTMRWMRSHTELMHVTHRCRCSALTVYTLHTALKRLGEVADAWSRSDVPDEGLHTHVAPRVGAGMKEAVN
jgi:hypothetical protein